MRRNRGEARDLTPHASLSECLAADPLALVALGRPRHNSAGGLMAAKPTSRPRWTSVLARAVEDENDPLNNVLKRSHESVKRVTLNGGVSLSERYAKHRCKLHVHLQLLRSGSYQNAANLCVVFENAPVPELRLTENISGARLNEMWDELIASGGRCMYEPVLVRVVEPGQHFQDLRSVVSRVGLQLLQRCPLWLAHPVEAFERGEVLRRLRIDGELNEIRLGRLPIDVSELPSKVVKRRTKVVGSLASDQPEDEWRRLNTNEDVMPAGLGVELGDDFMRVGCDVSPEFLAVGMQVCFDPIELRANARHVPWHGSSLP